ncbi:MAG: hypothetical protein IJ604_10130 [Prevotella sp.]|nr:hypothetical protein [Prevotella sp.]MBR1463710.1 hypothetical protein [Prevotella sp.]
MEKKLYIAPLSTVKAVEVGNLLDASPDSVLDPELENTFVIPSDEEYNGRFSTKKKSIWFYLDD